MHRQLTALALAAVFALGLTACSSPGASSDGPGFGSGGSQTVEEACTSFSAAMASGQAQLGEALQQASSDPTKTVEAFETLEVSLQEAFNGISNSEVSVLGQKILDNLSVFADLAADVIGEGKTDLAVELSNASNEFTLSMQELQTLCR